MGAALFGEGRAAFAWARRMAKLLKKPNGPFRVLHAAAVEKANQTMSRAAKKKFQTPYNYLRARTKYMQCSKYRLSIGSGVTEAACKMVFTERLKLSGLMWSKTGAQTILNLRVILLSGLREKVYTATLKQPHFRSEWTPASSLSDTHRNVRTKCA